MVLSKFYQMQSLFDLCIRKISHDYYSLLDDLDFLPLLAKEKILDILCKRGKADEKSLKDLANKQIKKLDLYGIDVTDNLLKYARVCVNIKLLTIATARNYPLYVTDNGLMNTLPHFKHLKQIQINNCIRISDRSIVTLADNCPNLEIVNLAGCSGIGDNALISLVKCCPSIHALTMARTKVSDKGIHCLSQSQCRHKLKELQLDGCNHITDNAIDYLSRYCHHITILTFSNCRGVTDRSRYILADFMERNGSQMKQMFWSIAV